MPGLDIRAPYDRFQYATILAAQVAASAARLLPAGGTNRGAVGMAGWVAGFLTDASDRWRNAIYDGDITANERGRVTHKICGRPLAVNGKWMLDSTSGIACPCFVLAAQLSDLLHRAAGVGS